MVFFVFHPDKWSEWMIRRKYVLGWSSSASPPDPCLTLYFLLQCSRGWLMDVSTGFLYPLASSWVQPMEDASSIWERKESGVSVLSAQLSACSVILGWLLSSDQDLPQLSGSGSCSVFCLLGPGIIFLPLVTLALHFSLLHSLNSAYTFICSYVIKLWPDTQRLQLLFPFYTRKESPRTLR